MQDEDNDYTDAAGRPSETPPGPRGQRMAQLGILTRAQKRKPVLDKIRTNQEGKPNPGDVENAKLQSSLYEKAREQKMAQLKNGPTQTIAEADPMKRSFVPRAGKPPR